MFRLGPPSCRKGAGGSDRNKDYPMNAKFVLIAIFLSAALVASNPVGAQTTETKTDNPTVSAATGAETDPLPSWNNGSSKQAIIDFVTKVTQEGSPDYVAPNDRVATFDNDGTLWAEKPVYFQLLFAIDRVKALAPEHPEWQDTQPYKAVLEGDMEALAASGEKGAAELIMATHAGMSSEEFQTIVGELATVKQPRFKRKYTDLVYQ